MSRLLTFHIPTPPSALKRMQVVSDYAEQFIRHNEAHGTAREFAEQAARDWKDKSLRLDVMREIRRQKRVRATV